MGLEPDLERDLGPKPDRGPNLMIELRIEPNIESDLRGIGQSEVDRFLIQKQQQPEPYPLVLIQKKIKKKINVKKLMVYSS